jgi:hypothetical protein
MKNTMAMRRANTLKVASIRRRPSLSPSAAPVSSSTAKVSV